MLDFAKFPFEKSVHLLTKFLPGFALLYVYNTRSPGAITNILSLPYLGYATRLWLLIAICFTSGYTFSVFLNSFASAAAGAGGALWASFARNKHPYAYQVAPWRDPNWRAAYIKRFGSNAPKDTTLVLPGNAAELLRLSQPLPPNAVDQQKLAEQITLQINSELKTAVDAIINDTAWRMCYERLKFKVLFESPAQPIDEVFGRLDSDFSLASAVLIVGSVLSVHLRVWWLMVPAVAWLAISILRFCVRIYQIVEPWNTFTKQMELLRSEESS